MNWIRICLGELFPLFVGPDSLQGNSRKMDRCSGLLAVCISNRRANGWRWRDMGPSPPRVVEAEIAPGNRAEFGARVLKD